MPELLVGALLGWTLGFLTLACLRSRQTSNTSGDSRPHPDQLPVLAGMLHRHSRAAEHTAPPGQVAAADQELTHVQNALADVGVDLNDPPQQLAVLALHALVVGNEQHHGTESAMGWLWAAAVMAARRHEEGAPA